MSVDAKTPIRTTNGSAPIVRRGRGAFTGLLRRMRADARVLLVVVVITALAAGLFAALPRLLNALADRSLAFALDSARPQDRGIELSRIDQIPGGPAGEETVRVSAMGDTLAADLPASVTAAVNRTSVVIDTIRYAIAPGPGEPALPNPGFLTLRYQTGIEDHVTIVEGRAPAATDDRVLIEQPIAGVPAPRDGLEVVEVAVTAATADRLGLEVGQRVFLVTDAADGLVTRTAVSDRAPIVVEVTGIIELSDPEDPFWWGDARLHRVSQRDTGLNTSFFGFALFASEAYPTLPGASRLPKRYAWRYFVDPASIAPGGAGVLAADVRRLEATLPPEPTLFGEPALRTGLGRILDTLAAQSAVARAVLAVAAAGVLAVALTVLGLIAVLMGERRRHVVVLLRGRGASGPQILAAQVIEAGLLVVPASLLGLTVAVLAVPGRDEPAAVVAAAGVAALVWLLLVATVVPLARRNLRELEQPDDLAPRRSRRRLALEGAIVVIAAAGVVVLRQRGIAPLDDSEGFDPYLAVVPVLLGVAASVLTLRLYPLPMRFLALAASQWRGAVGVLGLRRLSRQPEASAVPLLVLALAMAVSVFAGVVDRSIAQGQVDTSWQQVGADYRIDARPGGLLGGLLADGSGGDGAVRGLPGVRAAGARSSVPSVRTEQGQVARIDLLAIDLERYPALVADTPVAIALAPGMMTPPATSADGVVPVIASRDWISGGSRVGARVTTSIQGKVVTLEIRQVMDTFVELSSTRPWAVASLPHLAAAVGRPLAPTTLFVAAPPGSADVFAGAVAAARLDAAVTSRADVLERQAEVPLVAGTRATFAVAVVAALALSGVAIMAALVLTARARSRDLAFLRTLGLTRRQLAGLVAVELIPPVVLATAVGTVLGIATARLLEPAIDLTSFTGSEVRTPLLTDPALVLPLAGVLLAVAAVSVVAASLALRRTRVASAVRVGGR